MSEYHSSQHKERVYVRQVMSGKFAVVDGLITVAEGIDIARERKATALIVKKRHDDDEYGLVLLGDIARQVIAKDRAPARVNLYEIMCKPVISVSPDMDVRYCARLFERFKLHLAPVIEDDNVVGIVSYNNIVLNGIY